MASKDIQDVIRDAKEYTFWEAAKEFANPNTDEKSIQAAYKILCGAVEDGKLNARLIYHPNTYVWSFKDRVQRKLFSIYSSEVIRVTGGGISAVEHKINNDTKIWVIERLKKEKILHESYTDNDNVIINLALNSDRIDWYVWTIAFFKHFNIYKEELFNKNIDWSSSKVTGGNIHGYCMNEGITHPYFNPETVTPKQEPEPKPDTPADPAPEAGTTPNESDKSEIMSVPPEKYVLEPKPEVVPVADSEDKPTNKAQKRETDFSGLGEKKYDYTKYMDKLLKAQRQYDAYSLRWEYELEVDEIAKRMNITRQAVDKLLAKAKNKVDNQ